MQAIQQPGNPLKIRVRLLSPSLKTPAQLPVDLNFRSSPGLQGHAGPLSLHLPQPPAHILPATTVGPAALRPGVLSSQAPCLHPSHFHQPDPSWPLQLTHNPSFLRSLHALFFLLRVIGHGCHSVFSVCSLPHPYPGGGRGGFILVPAGPRFPRGLHRCGH